MLKKSPSPLGEIQHLHSAFRRDLDIGWFQIAMDHALFMRGFQRLGDLAGNFQRFLGRERTGVETVREGGPSTNSITMARPSRP